MEYRDREHARDSTDGSDGVDEVELDEEEALDPWALEAAERRERAPAGTPGRRTRVASRYAMAASQSSSAPGRRTRVASRYAAAARQASSARALGQPQTLASLEAELGPGQPLDGGTASRMGDALGVDVSHARLHHGAIAASKAREVRALAFAVGPHIVLGADAPPAGTLEGDALLAHELAHVAQQSGAATDPAARRRPIGAEAEPAEVHADEAAAGALAHLHGRPSHAQRSGGTLKTGLQLQRCPGERQQQQQQQQQQRQPQPQPPSPQEQLQRRAQALTQELQTLTDEATWRAIRRTAYPAESAAGVARAHERHAGQQPDMTGLGAIAVLDRFAAECRRIQGAWGTLDPARRRDQLGAAASAELVRAGVPAFLNVSDIDTEFQGMFQPSSWSFFVNRRLVTAPTLSDDEAGKLCNVTLHEARHAEQQFLTARHQAEQGRTAAEIATIVSIPQVIANAAHRRRLTGASAEVRELARRMNQANVTDGAANQAISDHDGLHELEARRNTALGALAALRASATQATITDAERSRDALRAQIAEVRRLYTLYRNIPYEADAHEVGDAAEEAFRGWR